MTRAPGGSIKDARAGRPRDRQIDLAVLKATLAVLGESGYGGLTLEAVARHAGTTKPSIYRRWPSRQRLVLSAAAVARVEASYARVRPALAALRDRLRVGLS